MIVAAPVRERFDGRSAIVAGANRYAAYVDFDGFVVALTARGVPLMPNGIALDRDSPPVGARVTLDLAGADVWDPTLRLGADPVRRGGEILRAIGRSDERSWRMPAADRLLGRGPGLTPEGDDILAATAAVVAARSAARDPWLDALLPHDLRARTTALSATLLELACAGQAIEPLHGLFGDHWRTALARLLTLGHSTGRAYATAAAYAASSWTSSTRLSSRSA
jgi:Protein of unknown function (DUF2877)